MYNRDGQEWLVCIVIIVTRLGTRLQDDEQKKPREKQTNRQGTNERKKMRLSYL
jgi:hypothetical protein